MTIVEKKGKGVEIQFPASLHFISHQSLTQSPVPFRNNLTQNGSKLVGARHFPNSTF